MTPWRFGRRWKFEPTARLPYSAGGPSLYQEGMAKKPRISVPESIINCVACHKPTNGKGWFGPGCQCEIELEKSAPNAHAITTRRSNWDYGRNGWKADFRIV